MKKGHKKLPDRKNENRPGSAPHENWIGINLEISELFSVLRPCVVRDPFISRRGLL